uniref:Isochorismatase-like domain-containing protein n=1 Tax=Bionectria ochroleuca TaxID=29856 RepID=A0A8H7K5X3_BIOOC
MASTVSFRTILGALASSASTSDSVIVIIDAQNEYSDGKSRVSNVNKSRAAIVSLLSKYWDAGAQVIHVVHAKPESAPSSHRPRACERV